MAQADALAAQAAADLILYQAGFSDGAASVVPSGTVTSAQEQTDIAAAVAAAVAPLNSQISSMQLALTQEQALLASVQSTVNALVALFAPPAPVAAP